MPGSDVEAMVKMRPKFASFVLPVGVGAAVPKPMLPLASRSSVPPPEPAAWFPGPMNARALPAPINRVRSVAIKIVIARGFKFLNKFFNYYLGRMMSVP